MILDVLSCNIRVKIVYINIQFLRFIAASMVVFFHATPVFVKNPENALVEVIALSGFSGVDIFFVISGFIIWHTTENLRGSAELMNFLAKRFTRIFSGYWPFLLFAALFIFLFHNGDFSHTNIIGSLFLLPIPIAERILPISWTLTFELYFYLTFSILLIIPKRKRHLILISAFTIIFMINFVGYLIFDFYNKFFFASVPLYFRIPFSPYNLEFLSGAILAAYNPKIKHQEKTLGYLLLFCSFFLLGILYNAGFAESGMDKGFYVVERVFFYGTSALFLLLFMLSLEQRNIVFPQSKSILLGGASYSIYLSHILVIDLIARVNNTASYWYILITVGCVILYSVIHYKYIEWPMYQYMKILYRKILLIQR